MSGQDDSAPPAVQLPLHGFEHLQYEEIMYDHGPVGGTASQPHYVEAANGQEYIVKGPSITPNHPEVGVNEYLCVQLAQYIGLPVLDFRLLQLGGDVFFASSWMTQGTFYPSVNEDQFKQSRNMDMVYRMAPFDCWVVNTDRHNGNLIVRRHEDRRGGSTSLTLLLNDHGHCLMAPGVTASTLAVHRLAMPVSANIRLPFVYSSLTDHGKLDDGVKTIENLPTDIIRGAIRNIPNAWLSDQDREQVFGFLLDRRAKLRTLLNAERSMFPALQGGSL